MSIINYQILSVDITNLVNVKNSLELVLPNSNLNNLVIFYYENHHLNNNCECRIKISY